MATQKPDTGFDAQKQTGKPVDWAAVVPRRVDSEDALGVDQNKATWEKLYREAGMTAGNEEERRALRAAVYVYCAKNGTSREGDYGGEMVLSTGKHVPAAVIPKAASRNRIRKFLRANMNESYEFFKSSRVMESDDRFIAKYAGHGISPDNAFAAADWLTDCPLFTPAEVKVHNAIFVHSIDRAARARGGNTLETVENDRVQEGLRAQGPPMGKGTEVTL